MNFKFKKGFTLVEILVVVTLLIFILYFAYQIFFSQTRAVTQTIDALQTNEGLRRVLAFMGDDIRESTRIVKPTPIKLEDVPSVVTTTGSIMILQSSEIDPRIKFDSPLGGQISQITTIEYELEPMNKSANDDDKTEENVPVRFRLIRNATIEEKSGEKNRQRQIIADNIKELMVYRTVRQPFKPMNVGSKDDIIIQQVPLSEAGTGNSLIHLKMVMERHRNKNELKKEQIYTVTMNTSFYKRGKEIFLHP
ncbi:MAG: prepilin-type N-terminal cleavage/methylation domain-containing protein [Candidatus Riflebacteria bacterium]|nr:prepilin-type N-terminal cleavage/methylation domain-containing protein [Candidatus Riflebacteria bacterium]